MKPILFNTDSDIMDFSKIKRKHTKETKEKLRQYALDQNRVSGRFSFN